VIFFVPDPARGVAEMARVVCPGGTVSAYAWDMLGGGFRMRHWHFEMRSMGVAIPVPPSPGASRMDAMRDLWTGAGLTAVETREISVQRTFIDFDDYWTTIRTDRASERSSRRCPPKNWRTSRRGCARACRQTAAGRITYGARANAVKGRAPI